MCLAVPGRVVAVREADGVPSAEVDFEGIIRTVSLAYVPDATVGEYVVAHLGFALDRMDEAEARALLSDLEEVAGEPPST